MLSTLAVIVLFVGSLSATVSVTGNVLQPPQQAGEPVVGVEAAGAEMDSETHG